ncbi:thiamine pyrophosphate-dependent dehydrogenase E1 component subunit alpha [Luteolibacter arcticus]|uniref:Thiamine pyrophosphate-dependent dehydrogenase E1 component subunit alpha n=1 Tax=Luteolibacter arcticus TaxID=1581411 RepID=A0ABT3GQ16_9BACT|nr:thiamine pyrophosphate-dependent dehydrogenase E1 component subunit alpha [Luteolibacter arcticus]MCW1925609.1 thiamine pyrophosphate-dependent dehydrogenase E1 component subunit alpha [Luteolibacter arcticus]
MPGDPARESVAMDYREHAINRDWSAEDKIDLFRQMLRIRRFEQEAMKYYQGGRIGGWLPLDIGQESIAISVRSVMGMDDHSLSGFRGIGHALAAGIGMGPIMAELFGKLNGVSKGKGGAVSHYSPALHHWGAYGLAAAHTPLAAGLAFALKQREIRGAVVCFMGDGSVNQGVYHEALNLAGLFGLPVVYLIENNGYAMGMSVSRSSRFKECLARRAEGYDIDWDHFGGSDPYEIRARVSDALQRARLESRPTVVEIETYRFYGFHIADANHQKYRTRQEVQERRARDPLGLWRKHLLDDGILDEAAAGDLDLQAKEEAMEAVRFAGAGEVPSISDIVRDVYWESDHDTEASRIGRHFFGE